MNDRRVALLRATSEWCDPNSDVRQRARAALADSEWPSEVIELALSSVLTDADEAIRSWKAPASELRSVAILPGNIVGPALATAFCAALAGASLLLKSASREQRLASIVADQLQAYGLGTQSGIRAMHWTGGDEQIEASIFARAESIVVFGDDSTVAEIERRAPAGCTIVGYGTAWSLGFVPADSDLSIAARAAAFDVAMFDQRGCLSPQTIYVEGEETRAILFARALAGALQDRGKQIPRARTTDAERAAVADFIRRLQVRAIPPRTHALDTVFLGRQHDAIPEFVVGTEPFSEPVCAGFGRIVIVKPCADTIQAVFAAKTLGPRLDTIGVASSTDTAIMNQMAESGARRVCALGTMQKPPFGYRPKITDFTRQAA